MRGSLALIFVLIAVARADVDGVCVTLHCGIQSGACFLDGDCQKVFSEFFGRRRKNAFHFEAVRDNILG